MIMDRAKFIWALLVIVMTVITDQTTKNLVISYIHGPSDFITVTPFFNIILTTNKGVSFSMLGTVATPWMLLLLTGLITLAITIWMVKQTRLRLILSLASIIGGSLGNMIDRYNHGHVIDFLDFHLYGYHWHTFNIADVAICLGALWMIIDNLLDSKQPKDQEK